MSSSTTRTSGRRAANPIDLSTMGSSVIAVPAPIRIASYWCRSSCARARDSGPVTQRESRVRVAIFPSSETASFK